MGDLTGLQKKEVAKGAQAVGAIQFGLHKDDYKDDYSYQYTFSKYTLTDRGQMSI